MKFPSHSEKPDHQECHAESPSGAWRESSNTPEAQRVLVAEDGTLPAGNQVERGSAAPASSGLSRLGLYVLLAGQLLPLIDFSIVNVALDSMSRSLQASPTELELVVAVYGVAFAVCLAAGGRLGDNLGRRLVLAAGVVVFGIASLLCGVAHEPWLLMAGRVLQGVAAALIVPQILATMHVCLKGAAHSRALGLYGATGGLSFIVGQVLGGFLVSGNLWGMGWRSVFLINLPVCVLVLAYLRHVPETRRAAKVALDASGAFWLAVFLMCLLLPLALGPSAGWSWPCVLPLLAAVPAGAMLWRVERALALRGGHPLLPPDLLRLPSVTFGLTVAVLFFASWGGFMFVMSLALQSGAGLTSLQAGNCFIVLGVSYFVASLNSAKVAARIGHGRTMILGCAVQIVGLAATMLTMHMVWPHPGVVNLALSTAIMGAGQALIVGSFWRIGLSDVPVQSAGTGGAALSTVQQAAFGFGAALLGSALTFGLSRQVGFDGALLMALAVELVLMLALALCAVRFLGFSR